MEPAPGEVTRLLAELRDGQQGARDQLIRLLYDDLRRIAASLMQRERSHVTLQPTALVHEAYLRLVGREDNFNNRAHFMAAAARAMRNILVDYARAREADKRGGDLAKVPLDENVTILSSEQCVELLALHTALDRLAEFAPRQNQVVEMRYFGGLTEEEIAYVLGVSLKTVKRDWQAAQAWLYGELTGQGDNDAGEMGAH
jgi:RNA polymerase sigma factor (TIGR02999 family)